MTFLDPASRFAFLDPGVEYSSRYHYQGHVSSYFRRFSIYMASRAAILDTDQEQTSGYNNRPHVYLFELVI